MSAQPPALTPELAARVRAEIIGLSCTARTPHLGSSLSCVEILLASLWHGVKLSPPQLQQMDRDHLVFSKGHAAMALYCSFIAHGLLAPEALKDYNQPGALLAEQPLPGGVPGIEAATGSLGHGLPLGVGLALGSRLKQHAHSTLVIMSDGECNEGSVWEAAMFAAGQQLENLTVVVDFNKWQATGRSREVLALDPLQDKWRSFGWKALEVDGHDLEALKAALQTPHPRQPLAIIAHTVKGKGVSFMEDDNNWHYRIPKPEEWLQARQELGVTELEPFYLQPPIPAAHPQESS